MRLYHKEAIESHPVTMLLLGDPTNNQSILYIYQLIVELLQLYHIHQLTQPITHLRFHKNHMHIHLHMDLLMCLH